MYGQGVRDAGDGFQGQLSGGGLRQGAVAVKFNAVTSRSHVTG